MTAGTAFYARQDNSYLIKLVGDIRCTMGCSLDDFIDQLIKTVDLEDIIVDLVDVTCIDSTSLGILAKIYNFMHKRFAKKTTLISTNKEINLLLENVGFLEVFDIRSQSPIQQEALLPLPIVSPSKTELTKTMYEAHNILSDLNGDNRKNFKTVVTVLENKLISEKLL